LASLNATMALAEKSFKLIQTLSKQIPSIGLKYSFWDDTFPKPSSKTKFAMEKLNQKLVLCIQRTTTFLEDIAAIGLSPFQAINLIYSLFPKSYTVSAILQVLWERNEFPKYIVIGALCRNGSLLQIDGEEHETIAPDTIVEVFEGFVVYGFTNDDADPSQAQSTSITAFASNGQTKDCNWDEFKRLVQAEATNSDSRTTALFRLNNIANQKQTHLNQQISSVLAALYETRATLRILVTIIADELLKDAIFLCNILTAVMQVTENKYIINHQLLKSSYRDAEKLSKLVLRQASIDWLPELRAFLSVLRHIDGVGKSIECTDCRLECQVRLLFPKHAPKPLAVEAFLEQFDMQLMLKMLSSKLSTLHNFQIANQRRKDFIFSWKVIHEEMEHFDCRFCILKDQRAVLSSIDSFLIPVTVEVGSVSSDCIELLFRKPSVDSADNPVIGVLVTWRCATSNRIDEIECNFDDSQMIMLNLKALLPKTKYSVSYSTVRELGYGELVNLEPVETLETDAPTISSAKAISPFAIQVKLQKGKSSGQSSDHVGYQVRVTDGVSGALICDRNFESTDTVVAVPIYGNGDYLVTAASLYSDKTAGKPSDPYAVKADYSTQEVAKYTALQFSQVADQDSKSVPAVYELQMDRTMNDVANQVRGMEYRGCSDYYACQQSEEKVIMIVGETGSGKTTLINSMVNYLFGVNYDDEFRMRIVADPKEKELSQSQSASQTQWVTSYTFHRHEGSRHPFTFTLVDTPGFGDTEGIVNDQKIVDRIRAFFSAPGGIDHLDAVGFVVPSSVSRLTPTQRYVFDSILSLFGRDVGGSIYILVTFADANEPPVLESLKEAKIPYNMHIKFNNSAVFAKKSQGGSMAGSFNKLFWDMGMESFKDFFQHVQGMQAKSLTLTKDVLQARERLQVKIVAIKTQIDLSLGVLNRLEAEIDVIKRHSADIKRNKDFTYSVEEEKAVHVDIPAGTYITNCLTCNRTCHYPCKIPEDKDKSKCAAMTDGKCHVCPGACDWTMHRNMPYRIEIQSQVVTKTSQELKARYQDASGKMITAKQLVQQVYEDYLAKKSTLVGLIVECKECIDKLKEIALKPDPLSEVDYIDKLIESERMNRRPGYAKRMQQLQDIRELAACTGSLRDDTILNSIVDNEKRVYERYQKYINKPIVSAVKKKIHQFHNWMSSKFR
ncbi:hypothetical protein BOX15_Mlig027469g1, partial [Macrostomum lignano]